MAWWTYNWKEVKSCVNLNNIGQTAATMVTMNYSFELDCNERNFFKILTNYENLSNYLPRKLKKIEILDVHDNYTTIEATILLRTIIKKNSHRK